MKSTIKWISFLLLILVSITFISSCEQLIENPKTYAITYHSNGSTGGNIPDPQVKTHAKNLTLAINLGGLVRTGYTFGGWNTESDGSGTSFAEGAPFTIDADTTLYAKWDPNEYTITYNANGATVGSVPADQTKKHDENLTLAPNSGGIVRTGYTFAGWNTESDGSGTTFAEGEIFTINAVTTLYAKWDANEYTITYNANGATVGSVPADQTKKHDQDLTLATNSGGLVRTGYTFAGWNTESDGSGTSFAEGAPFTIDADTTLYAKWRLPEVGDIGPAGGYIFYDQGEYINGWRYLEAAPEGWYSDANDPNIAFGYYRPEGGDPKKVGTSTDIGTGKYNTGALVDAMGVEAYSDTVGIETNDYAAKLASDYSVTVGGTYYNDWFLPSKDELNEMYNNLHKQSLGGFSVNDYWSSSEKNHYAVWAHNFGNNHQVENGRAILVSGVKVRPVRRF